MKSDSPAGLRPAGRRPAGRVLFGTGVKPLLNPPAGLCPAGHVPVKPPTPGRLILPNRPEYQRYSGRCLKSGCPLRSLVLTGSNPRNFTETDISRAFYKKVLKSLLFQVVIFSVSRVRGYQ